MGCAVSKILVRSWHFQEDVERRLKSRPTKGLEELASYKNGEHEKNSTMPVLAGLEEEEEDNDKTIEKEVTTNIGSKRKAMAKDLSMLEVPPFEFAKTGSQKEWLQQDGQKPYVTPKFGKFSKHGDEREDEGVVFDPELVAQFERAMNELATDEELVLRQITNGLE